MIALTQLRETVLRVMKKYGLLSEIRRRRKWVNLGQQVYQYKNLFARQFRADRPNSKWVADISYIQTKEGVLYLSMIRDLYDNSIVAYRTSSRQTVNLVLDAIRLAMKKKKKRVAAELQLHRRSRRNYGETGTGGRAGNQTPEHRVPFPPAAGRLPDWTCSGRICTRPPRHRPCAWQYSSKTAGSLSARGISPR